VNTIDRFFDFDIDKNSAERAARPLEAAGMGELFVTSSRARKPSLIPLRQ